MTPSNPLTDNMIGWSLSTTANTGLFTDRREAMDTLAPALEARRAGK